MEIFDLGSFGFDFYPVKTRDGSKVFAIDTPFLLADEHRFTIFTEQVGNYVRLFDEGSTVFDLRSFGVNFDERGSLYSSLDRHLNTWGIELTDSLSIEGFAPINQASALFAKYIAGLMSIDNWLRKNLRVKPSKQNLVNQSKTYFKIWARNSLVQDKPSIKDKFGKTIQFDFGIENLCIDSIFPERNSSANFIRKTAITRIAGNFETMAVIDDSFDKTLAQQEHEIVGTVTYAILLSRLANNAANESPFDLKRYA